MRCLHPYVANVVQVRTCPEPENSMQLFDVFFMLASISFSALTTPPPRSFSLPPSPAHPFQRLGGVC